VRDRSFAIDHHATRRVISGIMNIVTYMHEVSKEVQKVSWPSRQELVNNTILTLVSSLLFSIIIFAQDQIISRALQIIYS